MRTTEPDLPDAGHRLAREAWLLGYRVRHGREMTALVRKRFLA